MRTGQLLIVFCVLQALSAVSAARPLVFGTFPIPLMVESEQQGIFIDLTRALAAEAGLDIHITVFPAKRALSEFEQGNLDGLFPALSVTMPVAYERSLSIYSKDDFAFTLKGQPVLSTPEQLQHKRVGITAGYPYSPLLTGQPGIQFMSANTDIQNVQMLLAGRIDVFVVEEHSGLRALEQAGAVSRVQYDPARPLSRQDTFYAFRADQEGHILAGQINAALQRLQDSGTLANIMARRPHAGAQDHN